MQNNICKEIEKYLTKYPPALMVFRMLLEAGEVYAIGGLLREFRDNQKIVHLRDADFAVYIKDSKVWNDLLSQIPYTRNQFGGYKFLCSGFIIDIWDVRETWAFRKKYIKVEDGDYFDYLPQSVFLNIDAIVCDLKTDRWNDTIYREAIRKKELGIILKDNPFTELNILRSMILRKRYDMRYSIELGELILSYKPVEKLVRELMEIQKGRYGYEVLKEEEIWDEVKTAHTLF